MWSEKRLTRYEKARIIGARSLQLAYGAPSTIKIPEGVMDPMEIAKLELMERRMPIKIVRVSKGKKIIVDPNKAVNLSIDPE